MGQEEMATSCPREGLGWILWKILSPKGCPGKWLSPSLAPFKDVLIWCYGTWWTGHGGLGSGWIQWSCGIFKLKWSNDSLTIFDSGAGLDDKEGLVKAFLDMYCFSSGLFCCSYICKLSSASVYFGPMEKEGIIFSKDFWTSLAPPALS